MIAAVERYLRLRRANGFAIPNVHRDLRNFAEFCVTRQNSHLKTSDAVDWVQSRSSIARQRQLLGDVRRLGLFLAAEDSRHEVIPKEICSKLPSLHRHIPYVFTDAEIRAILKVAKTFTKHRHTNSRTIENFIHLIPLLAATGMRLSEAFNLHLSDLVHDELLIRNAKFGKDRIVYLHPSAAAALRAFIARRPPEMSSPFIFVSEHNGRLERSSMEILFRRCTDLLGMEAKPGGKKPRIHDLRHTFAIRSLAACRHDQLSVSDHIVSLSTYLGHVSIESTYWYCRLTAETKQALAGSLREGFYAQ